jgi:hypothetical protein
MDRFQRVDPISGQSVEVIINDLFVAENRWDDYQEVWLRFTDGRQYRTSFWRDPQQRGQHWIEEPGMAIVPDLSKELVVAAIDDILTHGSVEAAFEEVEVEG